MAQPLIDDSQLDINTVISAFNGAGGLNSGQTWQTPVRSTGVTYTNSTGNIIMVMASFEEPSGFDVTPSAVVNGVTIQSITTARGLSMSFVVPVGATYRIDGSDLNSWTELR